MILTRHNSRKYYARAILKARGFCFSINPPFTSASGIKEPMYTDHRLLLSQPKVLNSIATGMADTIMKTYKGAEKPTIIVGVAIGALPYATLVAQKLKLPMAYVRMNRKDHGRHRIVEGLIPKGARAIIIENVLVTGTSTIKTHHAIINSGATTLGVVSIYNLKLDRLSENMKDIGLKFQSLYDLDDLVGAIKETKYLEKDQIAIIEAWRKNPYTFFEDTKI